MTLAADAAGAAPLGTVKGRDAEVHLHERGDRELRRVRPHAAARRARRHFHRRRCAPQRLRPVQRARRARGLDPGGPRRRPARARDRPPAPRLPLRACAAAAARTRPARGRRRAALDAPPEPGPSRPPSPCRPRWRSRLPRRAARGSTTSTRPRSVRGVPTNADLKVQRALELFNGGQHCAPSPASPARWGRPSSAPARRPTEGSVVTIVVGLGASWYRYEVDLGDEEAGVRVVAQGTELPSSTPATQTPNAAADELGGCCSRSLAASDVPSSASP